MCYWLHWVSEISHVKCVVSARAISKHSKWGSVKFPKKSSASASSKLSKSLVLSGSQDLLLNGPEVETVEGSFSIVSWTRTANDSTQLCSGLVSIFQAVKYTWISEKTRSDNYTLPCTEKCLVTMKPGLFTMGSACTCIVSHAVWQKLLHSISFLSTSCLLYMFVSFSIRNWWPMQPP